MANCGSEEGPTRQRRLTHTQHNTRHRREEGTGRCRSARATYLAKLLLDLPLVCPSVHAEDGVVRPCRRCPAHHDGCPWKYQQRQEEEEDVQEKRKRGTPPHPRCCFPIADHLRLDFLGRRPDGQKTPYPTEQSVIFWDVSVEFVDKFQRNFRAPGGVVGFKPSII